MVCALCIVSEVGKAGKRLSMSQSHVAFPATLFVLVCINTEWDVRHRRDHNDLGIHTNSRFYEAYLR